MSALLDITLKNWKLNAGDRMALLLHACADTIGNVSILATPSARSIGRTRKESLHGSAGVRPQVEARCLACARELAGSDIGAYHKNCAKTLFATAVPPMAGFSARDLAELARQSVLVRITIPGVQKKLSVGISNEGPSKTQSRITTAGAWGTHILKPPAEKYPELPANEHLTMLLAADAGIKTEICGLIRLHDGELAFVARRFDRSGKIKFACEDLAQLTGRLTAEKYTGSLEQAARAIRLYSDAPGDDVLRFFELNVFCFLTGNADMHLKNFALLTAPGPGVRKATPKGSRTLLSPAYDLLNTRLALPSDEEETALTLTAKKRKLRRKDFADFAGVLGISKKVADRAFERLLASAEGWESRVEQSFLSDALKSSYSEIIRARIKRLR